MASLCLPLPCSLFLPKPTSSTNKFVIVTPLLISHLSKSGLPVDRSASSSRSSLMTRKGFKGDKTFHVFEQESLVAGDEGVPLPEGGLETKINSLSKWLITAMTGVIVIWRHDAEALWLIMGSVLNGVLSSVLKQVLNQDRPVSTVKSDPGMPSSHSQTIFFAATFFIVSMIEWLGVTALTLILSALVFAVASYLSWLRVSQKFHTVNQVLVGAVLGSAFAVFSFWSWDAFVQEAYNSHLWVQVSLAVGAAGFFIVASPRHMDELFASSDEL